MGHKEDGALSALQLAMVSKKQSPQTAPYPMPEMS
jgi:hypothetical protein